MASMGVKIYVVSWSKKRKGETHYTAIVFLQPGGLKSGLVISYSEIIEWSFRSY